MKQPVASDFNGLLAKLQHFCSYQDRCTWDVERKLRGWKVPEQEKIRVIDKLRQERMIDDRRFASSFTRGKFRINRWGRIRIAGELRSREVPEAFIAEALNEISEEEYEETIRQLIQRKSREINQGKTLNKREKIITFAVGKGYELNLVLRIIQEINS